MAYFGDMNSRLADIFESIALESMEMIAAKNAAGVNGTIKSCQNIKSFDVLDELHSSLAYELGGTGPMESTRSSQVRRPPPIS